MPTNKPRVTITMDEEMLSKIEDYRFDRKFKNQTQAILSLIEAGFDKLCNNTASDPASISKETLDTVKKYRVLDEHGKDIVDTVLDKEYERTKSNYIELVARGGKYRVEKDKAIEFAKSAVAAPNDAHNKDMF